MGIFRKIIKAGAVTAGIALAAAAGLYFWARTTNPRNYSTLGEIPAPSGFTRVEAPAGSFAEYTRSLPLRPRGTKVKLFTGSNARLQFLAAAVIDMPLLSNDEQCADATMRLRAEHLFSRGRYGEIRFHNVSGKTLPYTGGSSRKALESYLRKAYGVCSTFSIFNSDTRPQSLADVKPGDLWVFPARRGALGHAILVADVAEAADGRKAMLLVEGNTPARDFHVVRNPNPFRNPWFIIDPSDPGSSLIERLYSLKGGGLRTYP